MGLIADDYIMIRESAHRKLMQYRTKAIQLQQENEVLNTQFTRLLNKVNRVTSTWRHQHKVKPEDLTVLCNRQIDVEEAIGKLTPTGEVEMPNEMNFMLIMQMDPTTTKESANNAIKYIEGAGHRYAKAVSNTEGKFVFTGTAYSHDDMITLVSKATENRINAVVVYQLGNNELKQFSINKLDA